MRLEQESFQVAANVHRLALKLNVGAIPRDVVLKGLFVVETTSALVEVRKLGVLPNHDASA
jgi:hypothetical protein